MPYPPIPNPSDPRNAPGSNVSPQDTKAAKQKAAIDAGVKAHDDKHQSHLEQLWGIGENGKDAAWKNNPDSGLTALGLGAVKVIGTPIAGAWDLIDSLNSKPTKQIKRIGK